MKKKKIAPYSIMYDGFAIDIIEAFTPAEALRKARAKYSEPDHITVWNSETGIYPNNKE